MCTGKGTLHPYPTDLKCTQGQESKQKGSWNIEMNLDIEKKIEEIETPPIYQRMQPSCKTCYEPGTQSCVEVEESFMCNCKSGWTGFTCWKSPDLCELTGLQCGPNGRCVSKVDKAQCECGEFYAGEHCEYMKLNMSSYLYDEHIGVNGATAAALILTTGDICLMVAKAILKLYRPKEGEDTQVFYQNMRALFTSNGGLVILFFHHPGIMDISIASCDLWWFIGTMCFSLGICFFTLEAVNVYHVILAENRNVWGSALNASILPISSIAVQTFIAVLFTGGVLTISASTQDGKVHIKRISIS
ncbi:unnamed protein product [Cylicocyclus nassatus]|uniref:EGF-like domain-containing protein n=1 Tax=Cylicocyclus nassatus TaxID=53992 RepID=A0AA36DJW1_CYLNA|nr:unnamed protein product [Cylicocyclus nassatus]